MDQMLDRTHPRRFELPADFVFLSRIDLGLTAVLAELGATGPWGAIRREWDENGPPATPLGELDAAHRAAAREAS